MMTNLVSCPSCQCSLKLAGPLAVGKKVRCPKCQAVFGPPASTATEKGGEPAKPGPLETASNFQQSTHEATLDQPGPKKEVSTEGDTDGLDLGFLSPAQKPDELGRLAKFRILRVLGHGGMGAVLLAEDPKLKRQVALKVMLPQLAKSKQARERFLREAQAAAALEHDHIVPILEVGEDQSVPFIVMPLLRGESLDNRLKQSEPLSMAAILQIATQTTEALIVAHDHGFIHRDIKPANIWLEQKAEVGRMKDEKGKTASVSAPDSSFILPPSSFRVKLLDFGLARLAVHDEQHLTQTGALLGTPGYMAPEQAESREVDGRADVFSLGCVLYRLVTGKPAFPGDTMIARIRNLALTDPAAPRDVNPSTPPELSALIQRMLTKNLDLRPTAAEVLDLLNEMPPLAPASTEKSSATQCPPHAPREVSNPRAEREKDTGPPPAKKPPRRFVWLALALLLFAPLAWYAAGVILRVETENGTLLVEINDKDVEARVKHGKLILSTPDGKDRYTLAPHERNKLLAAGPYKIRVDGADGLSLDTEEFTLKKGETITVRVTLEAKRPTDGPTYTNSIGMEFVRVPKGKFFMGGGGGKVGDKEVEIPDDLYLGKYEVTQDEWQKVMKANPSAFSRTGESKDQVDQIEEKHLKCFPVERVSWNDAQEFIAKLNELEKDMVWQYRMPKESEWEYACRGGPTNNKEDYGFDYYLPQPTNLLTPNLGNYLHTLKKSCQVGSYQPNRLGLHNMHDNVSEWCDETEKAAEEVSRRVHRGGSWDNDPRFCRAAIRFTNLPSYRARNLGLRLARVRIQRPDPSTYTNPLGMEFVRVPKGKFFMGGSGGKVGDKEVEIPDDFYLGKYEVTQDEWQKVMKTNPSEFSRTGAEKDSVAEIDEKDLKRFPVESVSWNDAQAFVAKLNELEKNPTWQYRLPKEAEWEYACRDGPLSNKEESAFDFYFAVPMNQLLPKRANFDQALKRTCKVGSYNPNRLGLYDMHGNVHEWCDDSVMNAEGVSARSFRGGGWQYHAGTCQAAARDSNPPADRYPDLGLRLARVPIPQTATPKPPVEPGPKDAPIDFAAQRKAAELLLASKAAVFNLKSPNGQFLGLSSEFQNGKLPSEPFYINMIRFQPEATDGTLAILAGCDRLWVFELRLDYCRKVTAAGLKAIPICSRLTDLDLRHSDFGDDSLLLLERCPNLRTLQLFNTPVTDAGLAHLKNVPQLRSLSLPSSIGNAGLTTVVSHCQNLEHLSIGYQTDKISSIRPLVSLKRLRRLDCRDKHLNADGVAALLQIPTMENLNIEEPTAATFNRLEALAPQLRSLTLRVKGDKKQFPTGASWAGIANFKELEWLQTMDTIAIDAEAIERLTKMPNLRHVDFGGTPWFQIDEAIAISTLRRKRPDISLTLHGRNPRNYPSLATWPEGPDGGVAPWSLPKDAPAPAIVPFSADDAKKHQAAWAAYLKRPVVEENKLGMKFALISPGEFVTGEENQLRALVRVEKAFDLGATEVTVAQFQAFVDDTDYKTSAERSEKGGNKGPFEGNAKPTWRTPHQTKPDPREPVVQITSDDARAFCEWLSKKDGVRYRLPTEAEWELAWRAGGAERFGPVDTFEKLHPLGWLNIKPAANESPLHRVGEKPANPFGLFDMVGNVWEYCREGKIRGLSWMGQQEIPTTGLSFAYDEPTINVGFRVVRQTDNTPEPKPFSQPVLIRKGQPMSERALVPRPTAIKGLRSWSVEMAGHNGFVGPERIAWHPTGNLIATAGDNAIRLWNRQGQLQRLFLGHPTGHSRLVFSPDGKYLASGELHYDSGKSETRVWEVETGICRAVISGHPTNWVFDLAFAPKSDKLAIGGTGLLTVVDLMTGQRIANVSGDSVNSGNLAWSRDGQSLFREVDGRFSDVVQANTLTRIAKLEWSGEGKTHFAHRASWSPSGEWIAAGCGDGAVRLWDAKTLAVSKVIKIPDRSANVVSWSDENQLFLLTRQGGKDGEERFTRWDVALGKIAEESAPVSGGWTTLSPDGRLMLEVHDGCPVFYDFLTGKVVVSTPARGQVRTAGSISPNGTEIAHPMGGKIHFFDATNGALRDRIASGFDGGLAWSPDGTKLSHGQSDGRRVRFVERATGKKTELSDLKVQISSSSWSPDSQFFATGTQDGDIILWDAATGSKKSEWRAYHKAAVLWLGWSPDGAKLASSGSSDARIQIWDPATKSVLKTIANIPGARRGSDPFVWLPNSDALWVLQGTDVVRVDWATGTFSQSENMSGGSNLNGIFLSPDGRGLLANSGRFKYRSDDATFFPGNFMGDQASWMPDSRRALLGGTGYDVSRRRRLGTLFPQVNGDHWLCVGPDGHYRGSAGVEEHIVYVGQTDAGEHLTLSPAEFQKRFAWTNDPSKAKLLER